MITITRIRMTYDGCTLYLCAVRTRAYCLQTNLSTNVKVVRRFHLEKKSQSISGDARRTTFAYYSVQYSFSLFVKTVCLCVQCAAVKLNIYFCCFDIFDVCVISYSNTFRFSSHGFTSIYWQLESWSSHWSKKQHERMFRVPTVTNTSRTHSVTVDWQRFDTWKHTIRNAFH